MGRLSSGDLLIVDLWYLAVQLQECCILAIAVGSRACLLHDYPTKKEIMVI